MSQLLWIGCVEDDKEFERKVSKGYKLGSAQVSQSNLINGIEQISNIIFDSINGSVLPPYPEYKDKTINDFIWSHNKNSFDISVGYKNYKYINRETCKISMLKAVDYWIKNRYINDQLIVFVYSMRSAPMAAACKIKKEIPNAKIYLIVTDLPKFMDLGQSKIKAILKKFDWISIKRMQKKFDGFILYASKMAEFLKIPDDKWMLMEGSYSICETKICKDCSKKLSNKKIIMYSGTLDEQYGIKLLIDAFMTLDDPNFELWITGGGNSEKYLKECVSKDHRIKFYGFLPNRDDVLKKQLEADLLVNMRLPSESASAYCFPSKLFEYMGTGTPVLTFDIEGIPREYLNYLLIISDETVVSIAKAIKNGLSLDREKLEMLGKKAQKFICENKNNYIQAERICKFSGLIK